MTETNLPAVTPERITTAEDAAALEKRRSEHVVEDGGTRAKSAFESGQIPGERGRADDGVPSADNNAAANDRIRDAGLAAVDKSETVRAARVVKAREDSHARMNEVVRKNREDPYWSLGFNPNEHEVKPDPNPIKGDPGLGRRNP
jgi:hypothetical protein